MKKTYISPVSETIDLVTESLLASSPTVNINKDTHVDAGNSFTQKNDGWNSELWSQSDNE